MTYSHVRYAETGLVKEMRDDVRVVYGPSVNPSESRARHTLAATFLLAFAMLFAAALPAQAQTTIWSATLDPLTTFSGDPVPLGCDNTSGATWQCSNSDRLSDDDFTDDGMTYAVTKFFTKDGVLTFRLDTGATAATQGLTLVIDSEEFVLKEADRINGAKTQWKWNNTTLSWTAGTDVAVSLVVTDAPATGQPTISGGAQVSKTLTAATDDIEDLDGLPTTPTFTYQWVRVDGLTDTDIPGATSETYTLTASDLGKQIKVTVSFTDSRGHAEGPLTSNAYPPNNGTVVAAVGPCPAVNDWCATMTVADEGAGFGYEFDKSGSLDDNMIEYGDEEIEVFKVSVVNQSTRERFFFESFPRVPLGTVITVGDLTLTTDTESEDGINANKWDYNLGGLPPDLVWSDGQEVRISLVLGSSPPRLSIADASAAENDGQLMFDVTLSPASPHTVKVDFETTSGGTATEGVDYWPHVYTHVIPYGETTTQMGFALIEDTVAAAGETVMVRLSNARQINKRGKKKADLGIARAEATGTINAPTTTTTNVPGLTIRIKDATGDEDSGWLVFNVRLSRKHDDYVCYDFETISGGTAEEGTDYLKFPKATYWMQIGKRVDKPFVRIIDDRVNDNGETVKVKISNARLCNDASQTLSITMAEATGTIRNTDPLPRALKARFGRTVARAGGGGQETVLNFAHFANGNGTTSDLVFVNVSTRPSGPGLFPYHAVILPSRPTLYFYDQEGNLLDPASVVDLTGDLVVTEDGALSIQTEMEPLGELTISTHGRGELVSGSVKVVSEGPLGGVLRYALPGIGVTGVGDSPPVQDALFPVRQEGGLDTAAAIRNLSESDLVVTCRLMKEGAVLEETEIPLAANGQESQYLEEMFTFTGADVSDFVGSVRCTVPAEGEGMFTGVAVEIDAENRILTTLPVVPVARAGGGGQETVLDFAHFANGNGTTSDLVFVNVSTRPSGPGLSPYPAVILPSRPTLYFYDQEGNLLDPASVVDLTGDLVVTEDGALSIQTEMEPLGELTISTHGRGELVSGSVRVVSDGPIGGVLRFDLTGIGVAGVGASQPVRDALFPARRQADGISTAAAIHNLGEEALVVGCQLMKDGAVLEEEEIPLEANGQEARYIEEMFTSTDTSDFVGSVRCTAPEGEGMFTGVAVELDASNQIFTTLPVVPVPERMSQE